MGLPSVPAWGTASTVSEASQCTEGLLCAQMHFHDRIAQLVYTFPEDAPTSTGALFWSAPKRFPRALEWSAADPSHVAFVQAAALLRAEVFGITPPAWAQDPAKVILRVAAPAAVPVAFVLWVVQVWMRCLRV